MAGAQLLKLRGGSDARVSALFLCFFYVDVEKTCLVRTRYFLRSCLNKQTRNCREIVTKKNAPLCESRDFVQNSGDNVLYNTWYTSRNMMSRFVPKNVGIPNVNIM